MADRKKRRHAALVPVRPAQLAPTGATPPPSGAPDPLATFLHGCSPSSRATFHARLHAAARALGSESAEAHPWVALDYATTVRALAALADAGAAPSTLNLTRSALRKMARVLFHLKLLDAEERRRIDDVPTARGQRLPRRAFTAREIRKLFAACARDGSAAGRRDAALLACLFGGGLRRDEASKLDVADVRADGLRVRGKGSKERLQPIGADAARAVQEWIELRGRGVGALFLVIDKFGRVAKRRLLGAAMDWKVKRRAAEASIEGSGASPHALRRAFGTGLLEAGEDLATVAKALGHASVTTTARCYDVRDGKRVAAAVAKLVVPFGR